MREIKFRSYRKGLGFHFWGVLSEGEFTGPIHPADIHEQFTGLLDGNGTEIYEGDVVNIERCDNCFGGPNVIDTEVITEIEWPQLGDCESGGPDGNYPIVWMDVIANIHTNPEFLDVET